MSLGKYEKEKISRAVQKHSSDALNFGRTAMANERTLLAFIRTAISLLAAGVGFILLLEHPLLIGIGWFFIGMSVFIQIWGLFRYFDIKKILFDELPDDVDP
jgi:putative membrane protein